MFNYRCYLCYISTTRCPLTLNIIFLRGFWRDIHQRCKNSNHKAKLKDQNNPNVEKVIYTCLDVVRYPVAHINIKHTCTGHFKWVSLDLVRSLWIFGTHSCVWRSRFSALIINRVLSSEKLNPRENVTPIWTTLVIKKKVEVVGRKSYQFHNVWKREEMSVDFGKKLGS